jgi:hypothetical protein
MVVYENSSDFKANRAVHPFVLFLSITSRGERSLLMRIKASSKAQWDATMRAKVLKVLGALGR